MKKYNLENIKLKYLDFSDNKDKTLFKKAMKVFLEIFPEDCYYIGTMKKMLYKTLKPANTKFRIFVAIDTDTQQVIGVAIYRHWTDINISTLEYIMAKLNLRGSGIGTIMYKFLQQELIALKSKGLIFSCAGDTDLYKYDMEKMWRIINVKRAKFYERYGARPLTGINYQSPMYWSHPEGRYCFPNLCFDPLNTEASGISSEIIKIIVKRIMASYYNTPATNKNVQRILASIKTEYLEMRKPKYIKNEKN